MLEKKTGFTFNHSDQQDDLYTSMTTAEIKTAFDSRGEELKEQANAIVDALQATTEGDSGADNIGASTITGVTGNTVQAQTKNLKEQIDALVTKTEQLEQTDSDLSLTDSDLENMIIDSNIRIETTEQNITTLQTNKADKTQITTLQDQVDALVVDGDSSPAIAQALAGSEYTTLKQKLDSTDTLLAEIATNIKNHKLETETDWTLALRRAIATTPRGGTLLIPPNPSGYLVKAQTEKYLFKLDKPIRIIGYGVTSMLLLDESIPNDTDIFLISPATSNDIEGYEISGITGLGRNGSTPARHFIHIDTTQSHQKVARSKFIGNFIYPTGGNSFFLTNPTNSDGFFTSQIQKNLIYSGINFQRGGDSLTITENTIAGYNGVDISLVSGSNTLVFAFNNVTARKGLIFRSGHNIKILYNNLEVGYSDSSYTNGALLDIDGSNITEEWGLLAVEILGNNFTYRNATAPDGVNGIRINKARGAKIEGNYITHKNSTMIVITSLAQETRLGYNLYSSSDPSGIITDSGRNTIREKVHKTNAVSGQKEVYEIDAAVARWKAATMWDNLDVQNYEPINTLNAPSFNHIWNAANTSQTKYQYKTQQRNADGTLATAKTYAGLGDGFLFFHQGGLALVDSVGYRWKLNVNTDGTLTTTRI